MGEIIGGVIGLEPYTQHSALTHGVSASGHVANPGGSENEIDAFQPISTFTVGKFREYLLHTASHVS